MQLRPNRSLQVENTGKLNFPITDCRLYKSVRERQLGGIFRIIYNYPGKFPPTLSAIGFSRLRPELYFGKETFRILRNKMITSKGFSRKHLNGEASLHSYEDDGGYLRWKRRERRVGQLTLRSELTVLFVCWVSSPEEAVKQPRLTSGFHYSPIFVASL